MIDDLVPEFLLAPEAARYLRCTTRKVSLYRRYGLLKSARYGKNYVYKKSWLDAFADEWSGTDLSSEEKIRLALNSKNWKEKHGYGK